MRRFSHTLLLGCLLACTPPTTKPPPDDTGVVAVQMDYTRAGNFYAAPFPSDSLLQADGSIALDGFPNPYDVDMLRLGLETLARDARGFALTGGTFFALNGTLDPTHLPTLQQSSAVEAGVFLMDLNPLSPDFQKRHPVHITFQEDGGPMGARNMLALLPVQGIPLRPATRYAAVVLRSTRDGVGKRLQRSPAVDRIDSGESVDGMSAVALATHRDALNALKAAGVAGSEIAAFTAFTTGDPVARMRTAVTDALAVALPTPETAFRKTDTFDDYCVYASTVRMPSYQHGEPPFSSYGGAWARDASGHLVLQQLEQASLVVTIPRREMPAAGYPATVFIRTGGGGLRPLVDRGVHAVAHGENTAPGEGPALHFARAGFAGISVDGPHGGLRNVSNGDEQFLTFNVFNPPALRDNIRQSALEIILLAHMAGDWMLDVTDCEGARTSTGGTTVHLDEGILATMGHSMGASIAPLVVALEPRYRAMLLSGAGASWIENVLYKEQPLVVKPMLELLFGYTSEGITLTPTDPTLTIVQWAAEDADAQVYARNIVHEPVAGEQPRHVLMMQGIVDHYILPNIANALSASLGLDLAGSVLDATHPELTTQTPAALTLGMVGRGQIALPASANVTVNGMTSTAVVLQYAEDGIEDGHEAVFQTETPKHQYRCFLEGLARGSPSVPVGGALNAPCE